MDKVEKIAVASNGEGKSHDNPAKISENPENKKESKEQWPTRAIYKSGVIELTEFGYKNRNPRIDIYEGSKIQGKQPNNAELPSVDHRFEQLRGCVLEALKGYEAELKNIINVPIMTSDPIDVIGRRLADRTARLHRDVLMCFDGYQLKDFSAAERRLEEERLRHGDGYYAKYHSLKRDYTFLLERSAQLGNTLQRLEESELNNERLQAKIDVLEEQLELFRQAAVQQDDSESLESHNSSLDVQTQENTSFKVKESPKEPEKVTSEVEKSKATPITEFKPEEVTRIESLTQEKRNPSPEEKVTNNVKKEITKKDITKEGIKQLKPTGARNTVPKEEVFSEKKTSLDSFGGKSAESDIQPESVHFSELPSQINASEFENEPLYNKEIENDQNEFITESLLNIPSIEGIHPSTSQVISMYNTQPIVSEVEESTAKSIEECSLFLNDVDPNQDSNDVSFLEKHNSLLEQELNFEEQRAEKLREEEEELLDLERIHHEKIMQLHQSESIEQEKLYNISESINTGIKKPQNTTSGVDINQIISQLETIQQQSEGNNEEVLEEEVDRLKEELTHKDLELSNAKKELGLVTQELQGKTDQEKEDTARSQKD